MENLIKHLYKYFVLPWWNLLKTLVASIPPIMRIMMLLLTVMFLTLLGGDMGGFFGFIIKMIGYIGIVVVLTFIVRVFLINADVIEESLKPVKSDKDGDSGIDYLNPITDFSGLERVLNYRAISGEPLVLDDFQDHRITDKWGIDEKGERGRYTVSTQERGLILGVSGSGKTTYLVTQLLDWMQSGKSFVVNDIKPEIWAILKANGAFEHFGYKDIVINPTDPQAKKYNMLDDMDAIDINEMLNTLIYSPSADGETFASTARFMLYAVIMHLKEDSKSVSLVDAKNFIDSYDDLTEMLEDLIDSDSETAQRSAKNAQRSAVNERYISGAQTAIDNALSFVNVDMIRENIASSDVSLLDELQQPKRAVFLQFEKRYTKSTYLLSSLTIAHVLRLLEVNYRDREDVFIAIDEIINGAPIADLTQKLNVMRSSKMPMFMYLQTLEGLNRVYGDKAEDMFLSACALKVCYRVDDNKTSQMMSEFIGTTEVKKWQIGKKDRTNLADEVVQDDVYTESTEFLPKIEPIGLTQLQKGEAVVIYQGQATICKMPYYKYIFPAVTIESPDFGTVSEYKLMH